MNYITFKKKFERLGCFCVNQVRMVQPDFDRTAFTRWVRNGYLVRLRQSYYAFSDWLTTPNVDFITANFIYQPSYVSGYTALAFYGIIPEFIPHIISTTSIKTILFKNKIGTFSYFHVKPELFFGYLPIDAGNERKFLIALPEKALLDLLYLNPSISSADDMTQLRLDEDFMSDEFDWDKAHIFLKRFSNKSLSQRFSSLEKVYKQ